MSREDSPGLIVPPPVYVLTIIVISVWLNANWPAHFDGGIFLVWVGYLVSGLAVSLLAVCMWQFHVHETDIRPHKPARCMIRQGPYRYSRNPIYLGFLLFQLGYGLTESQWWVLASLPASYLILRYHVIAKEEDYQSREFGNQYRQDCVEVRRWL